MNETQHETARRFLISGLVSGRFAEGDFLPSVDAIALSARSSPHAVRRAFRELSDKGILQSIKKKGTRVLRRPAVGRALFVRSRDTHTNAILQEAVEHALIQAGLDVGFTPNLFSDGAGVDRLWHLAGREAHDTVLVTLTQEGVPTEIRPEWEKFAARFRGRVGFQFEDNLLLPDSVTILPDPVAAARLVADHLLKLGHRRIGVVAGVKEADGSASERHTSAIEEMLALVGAECFPYQYGRNAEEGVSVFVRRNRCTAWWTINDHQALDHIYKFQRAGLRVPEDISVIGCNDTPWAANAALPLTTLSLDPPAIGRAIAVAVEAVFAGKAEKKGVRRQFIRPVLVPRASTVAVGGAAGSSEQ